MQGRHLPRSRGTEPCSPASDGRAEAEPYLHIIRVFVVLRGGGPAGAADPARRSGPASGGLIVRHGSFVLVESPARRCGTDPRRSNREKLEPTHRPPLALRSPLNRPPIPPRELQAPRSAQAFARLRGRALGLAPATAGSRGGAAAGRLGVTLLRAEPRGPRGSGPHRPCPRPVVRCLWPGPRISRRRRG